MPDDRLTPEEADHSAADIAIDAIDDQAIRELMRTARGRDDFARVAASIAEDRHGAGSAAACCAVAILLWHGVKAAMDFAADLEHHEN